MFSSPIQSRLKFKHTRRKEKEKNLLFPMQTFHSLLHCILSAKTPCISNEQKRPQEITSRTINIQYSTRENASRPIKFPPRRERGENVRLGGGGAGFLSVNRTRPDDSLKGSLYELLSTRDDDDPLIPGETWHRQPTMRITWITDRKCS